MIAYYRVYSILLASSFNLILNFLLDIFISIFIYNIRYNNFFAISFSRNSLVLKILFEVILNKTYLLDFIAV